MGIVTAQTDFSGGQINEGAKRSEDQQVKTGGLVMLNGRQEAQGTLVPRPGRRALYAPASPRTDTFRMSGSVTVQMSYPIGKLVITGLDGSPVAVGESSAYRWADATVAEVSAVQAGNQIVICFPGMQPQVAQWTPASNTWTFAPFVFSTIAGIVQEPFYRFSVPGALMTWDASTNAYATVGSTMTLSCTAAYFTAGMLGSRLSILGGQVTINQVLSPTQAVVTVNSRLPDSIAVTPASTAPFQVGQVAETTTSGYRFEIIRVAGGVLYGPLMNNVLFTAPTFAGTDIISSELGTSTLASTSAVALLSGPTSTVQWQEEFMSAPNGWPAACFYDQNRLGFCDFPQKPEAILWCAIGLNQTAYIDATAAVTDTSAGTAASAAILEFIAKKVRVRNVVGWGDEFVFTDKGIFQIPLSTGSPLKPGGVEFREFSNDGCSGIRPIPTLDAIIYVNAGLRRVGVVRATGSYTRPYVSDDLTALHSDLIVAPTCLAVATGDGDEPERYVYVVNSDGTAILGRFTPQKQIIGWVPISGAGAITWIFAELAAVYVNASYGGGALLEVEDAAYLCDAAVQMNLPPGALVKSGFGPLWWLANGTVALIDNGFDRGDRAVDARGNVIAQPGEDLSSATLQAGASFPFAFAPVIPPAPASASPDHIRMKRRKIIRAMVRVQSACPFNWGGKDVPAYQFGDDADVAAPLREGAHSFRPLGRSYDPSVTLTRSRPGFLRILECVTEVTG